MTLEREIGWQQAIVTVLKQETGIPLNYQRITELIGERGVRSLTGATPARTVNRELHYLADAKHPSHNPNIQKIETGVFAFVDPSDPLPLAGDGLPEETGEEFVDTDEAIRVCAFGLHWEKDKVSWGKGEILGRQRGTSVHVNFADQNGVYLLHKGDSVVYVGRAFPGTLHSRLNEHRRSRRANRWNRFSWFGFREVSDDGALEGLSGQIDPYRLIVILESVLIEALEPPVNGKRGEGMGELYEQVSSPDIAAQNSKDFLRSLSGG